MRWDELPLARSTVDRAAHRRDEPGLVARLLEEPSTRVVLARAGQVAVRSTTLAHVDVVTSGTALDLLPADDAVVRVAAPLAERFFLGGDDSGDYVALVLPTGADDDTGPELGADRSWASLREIGGQLGARDAGLATTTIALASWHESHRFCSRCGAPTEPSYAGWQRRCTAEGTEMYPRTDPAVIMAVTDADDRLLLGRATHWPPRRFSTLAGFVEAGESAEQALRREVMEEVSLPVTDIVYRGSQTWPFPASLMLAYQARATSTTIVPDGVELAEARWFDRASLEAAATSGDVRLPGRASIARALVEEWFGGPLP